MCTVEGSTDKIRIVKRPVKLCWLCWELFSAKSVRWTEGGIGTEWILQETNI